MHFMHLSLCLIPGGGNDQAGALPSDFIDLYSFFKEKNSEMRWEEETKKVNQLVAWG